MPGDVTFRIEGAAEMAKLLKELGSQTARRVGARSVKAGAKPIVDRAKQMVPVRTGALRDAITSAAVRRGISGESVVEAIGVERPVSRRAHLTEFGTAHSSAHPFLRPAMDEQKQQALDEMGHRLGEGITREAERLAGIMGTRRRR